MTPNEEWFPIIDEEGHTIGKATRYECHNNTFILHPVVHLHLFNNAGELYLQKRAMTKDIQPGKWDTAVGGHIDFGEEVYDALLREVREELNITSVSPLFLYKYIFTSDREKELVYSYKAIYNGEIIPDVSELEDGKFWSIEKIKQSLGKDIFTPNFEYEFPRLLQELDKTANLPEKI